MAAHNEPAREVINFPDPPELLPRAPKLFPRGRRKPKDRYRLLKLLGQGSWGAVYKAEDLELDRIIAIKLLHAWLFNDERYLDALKREVVIASGITHPNVVRVFDLSKIGNAPALTMEYIQGETLASALKRNSSLSIPRVWHYLRQICSGLEEAHRCGVVHRDLKPQNILVSYEGKLFISDFGLAHASREVKYRFESNDGVGTLRYMSPEQFHALPVDTRSDIFSLGLILYEMLSGVALEVDHNAAGEQTIDSKTGLVVLLPDTVPAALRVIALCCLARNPAERYQNVSEILALMPHEIPADDCIEPIVSSNRASGTTPDRADDDGSIKVARGRKRGWMLGVVMGFLVLLIGTGIWSHWRFQNGSGSSSFEQLYRAATSELAQNNPVSLQKAATLFQSAASLRPSDKAFEGLAKANLRTYQLGADRHWLTQARTAIEKAEQLNQRSRSANLLHAEIDLADGQPGAAMLRLNRMLSAQSPSDEVLRLVAKSQLLAGHVSESLETWQKVLTLNPNYWVNHNGFGSALMALGHPNQAKAEFRKVIQLNPSSYVGYANLGAAYVSSGEFEKAIPVTEKSLSIQPAAPQYNNLGTALYYTGSCHAALQLFRRAVELNPHSELYFGNLGEAYRCTGDKESAKAAYVNALELAQEAQRQQPSSPRATARLAILLAKMDHFEEAQHMLASALAREPENPEVLYSKAVMCVIQNEYSEAALAAKAALSHGYSIAVAARDPELKALWADPDLMRRFQAELSRGSGSNSQVGPW